MTVNIILGPMYILANKEAFRVFSIQIMVTDLKDKISYLKKRLIRWSLNNYSIKIGLPCNIWKITNKKNNNQTSNNQSCSLTSGVYNFTIRFRGREITFVLTFFHFYRSYNHTIHTRDSNDWERAKTMQIE